MNRLNATHSGLRILQTILILAGTIIVYFPSVQASFIWDDDVFLTHNPIMESADALRRFWTTTEAPDYFPLTSTVLWLQRQIWGLEPLGYHVFNIALHAVNAFLFWRILERLPIPGAWAAGLIFAVHPVHVESVSWITQIKNVQSTFFYLASIYFYLASASGRRLGFYLFSLILLFSPSSILLVHTIHTFSNQLSPIHINCIITQ